MRSIYRKILLLASAACAQTSVGQTASDIQYSSVVQSSAISSASGVSQFSAYSFPAYPSISASPFQVTNLTDYARPNSTQFNAIDGPPLELVHEIYGDFLTGVAITTDNRIFMNYPRSAPGVYVPTTIATATNFTSSAAYPNASIQNCEPGQNLSTCFINVQSVVVDSIQRLWILDTGISTDSKVAQAGGAKIMSFNTTTDTMVDNFVVPTDLLVNGTNINDVRFNLTLGTAGYAFLSDEGNSLFVLDLGTGEWRRRLFNTTVTRPDEKFVGSFDGTPFYAWNGTARSFLQIGADGIALASGNLYFAPLAARRLYQVAQRDLVDASLTDAELLARVEFIGQTGSYLEGFTSDNLGRVYMGTAEQNSITYFNTTIAPLSSSSSSNGTDASLLSTSSTPNATSVVSASNIILAPFVRSSEIQWPDSMCIQNGYLWFSVNQLPLLPQYQINNVGKQDLPYGIYRAFIGDGVGPAM